MDPLTFSGIVSFGIKLVLALGLTKEVIAPILVPIFGGQVMDKYRKTAEMKLGNKKSNGNHKIHPEELARQAHVKGHFAAKERTEFFDEVYGEVLIDLFIEWLKTDPHETKTREFLYSSAMALGSVKERMIRFETYGKNIPHILEDNDEQNN